MKTENTPFFDLMCYSIYFTVFLATKLSISNVMCTRIFLTNFVTNLSFCVLCSISFCFPFIFISWRLITLQYCSGFCHTLTWISHGFTPWIYSHGFPIPIPSPTSLPFCSISVQWKGISFGLVYIIN